MCLCVCNRYLGCVIWNNYEMVGFQPRSGNITDLDPVSYFRYLYYSSPDTLVTDLATARGPPPTWAYHVSVPESPSTAWDHQPTRASPISISASLLPALLPRCYPWILMHLPLAPFISLWLTWCLSQSWTKMCIHRLLTPPCIPPVSYPIISLLSCAHLKNSPHRQPLWHRPLSYTYLGHCWLCSWCFPNYFWPRRIPYPIWIPLRLLPHSMP